MSQSFPIQTSFSRGELTERLHVRADIDHWKVGLAECYNFYVLRQGGARRRPGTRYAAMSAVQGLSDTVRLVPFVFSSEQAYVLELSHLKMRFFTLGGQVLSGGIPYEIATPWTAGDLEDLQFAQSADTVYVTHQSFMPRKILRVAETNWTITTVTFVDGPYGDIDATDTVLTPGSTGSFIPVLSSNTGNAAYIASNSAATANAWILFCAGDNVAFGDTLSVASWAGAIWWQIAFTTSRVVDGYMIENTTGQYSTITAPRTWRFEGSNDGVTFTTLDNRVGVISWGPRERRFFQFTNSTAYLFYRITILANNGDPSDTSGSSASVAIRRLSLKGGGADKQSVTLTASATTGINGGSGFLTTDVGRQVRVYSEDAYWHWGTITARASSTQVTVTKETPPFASTAGFPDWRLGAFSDSSGYPRAVSFFQERLCYGGTRGLPQTVWASTVGGFDDFSTSIPLLADDAFQFTLADVSPIQWLAESGDIMIGTSSAIRNLTAADKNKGLSATNVQQGRPARAGTTAKQPALAGEAALFVSKDGKAVRELTYSFDAQAFVAPDVSVLSEHITVRGVKQFGVAPAPNAWIWFSLADGSLGCMTYEREQQMLAITDNGLGGTGAFVESITAIPASTRFEVWLCVRRTASGGGTMRTIEYFSVDFERESQSLAFYVDCGLTYNGSPTSVITGLTHLNGQTVQILADGKTHATRVVSGGSITLDAAYSVVNVGLGYESRIETLPISAASGDGTALGRRVNISKVIAHFLETGQAKVKAGGRDYTELFPKHNSAAKELLTGNRAINVSDTWRDGGQVFLKVDSPQPCTLLGLTPAFETEP
jgi:hypothetical protein